MSKIKSFDISKQAVWDSYLKVKSNHGAAGVDQQSIELFEEDLKDNLYKTWNRMSSGSYFPPPVLWVEIPKGEGEKAEVGNTNGRRPNSSDGGQEPYRARVGNYISP